MKINKIDTYVMVALAFMPLLVSSAVAVSTIGETSNDIPTVSVQRKYITNNISSSDDFVYGNYYVMDLNWYTPTFYNNNPTYDYTGLIDFYSVMDANVYGTFMDLHSYFSDLHFDFLFGATYLTLGNSASTYINSSNRQIFNDDISYFRISRNLDSVTNKYINFQLRNSQNVYYNFSYLGIIKGTIFLKFTGFPTGTASVTKEIFSKFIRALNNDENPIVSAGLGTETIENVFVRNLTYFNDISFVKPIYNWCVTNMLGGVSNPIFDIAHSYLFYVMFLFLCYLMLSVLLFFVKFGIKALNWFYDKSFGGGS